MNTTIGTLSSTDRRPSLQHWALWCALGAACAGVPAAASAAGKGDEPRVVGHTYRIALLAPYTGPQPVLAGSILWRCEADQRHCTAVSTMSAPTVGWCGFVVSTLGWATGFGMVDGPALSREQLAECNRQAPNRPQTLKPDAAQAAGRLVTPRPPLTITQPPARQP
ncbi:hypothetical protein AACH06_25340 [Ideonella sp. DXS29W]|uniref:Uncharacterized protein n=1 Tax=Ideonella lacteola TaxID=2984193 RepID=A0ABU9BW18_9BURK